MTDYTKTGIPISGARGISKNVRDEFTLIETAVNSKADIASPTFTGTPAAPTASSGTNTTQIATTAFVIAESFVSSLPSQSGNAGKLINTDGATASWGTAINATVMNWADGADATKLMAFDLSGITTATTRTVTIPDADFTPVGTTLTQTLTNKTLTTPTIDIADNAFTLQDNSVSSKKAVFELSGISTSTTRTLTIPNENITIVGTAATQTLTNKSLTSPTLTGTPTSPTAALGTDSTQIATTAYVLNAQALTHISTVVASAASTADVEDGYSSYDAYMIVVTDLTISNDAVSLVARIKTSGSYITTTTYNYHVAAQSDGGGTYAGNASAVANSVLLGATMGNLSTESMALVVTIFKPQSTALPKRFKANGLYSHSDGTNRNIDGFFTNDSTAALSGVRFFPVTGTLSGTFRLYGIGEPSD